jgi:hypothetical protein
MLANYLECDRVFHDEFLRPSITTGRFCNVSSSKSVEWRLVHHDNAPTRTALSVQQVFAVRTMAVAPLPFPPTLLTSPIWPLVISYFREWYSSYEGVVSRMYVKFRNIRKCYVVWTRNGGTHKGTTWPIRVISCYLFFDWVRELLDKPCALHVTDYWKVCSRTCDVCFKAVHSVHFSPTVCFIKTNKLHTMYMAYSSVMLRRVSVL